MSKDNLVDEKKFQEDLKKFKELTSGDLDVQLEWFLKSFIFDLGDDWKNVMTLQKAFRKRLADAAEGKDDLNPVMAADFLQKNGLERTATQRKAEVQDIDLDKNDRIAFIEYLLLHYKAVILTAFYKRIGKPCPHDLSKGGIGVCGVGRLLLDELCTLPMGLDPALEKAIEEFMAKKRARETKVKDLEAKSAKGGVSGLTATNEIKQMESQDLTEMNRMEITLNAAKKRAATQSGDIALQEKKKKQEDEDKAKRDASRNKLKGMAAQWEKGPSSP